MENASAHDLRRSARRKDRRPAAHVGIHAFTLIELLVVIGIVGVLIALSVPALRSTRNQAFNTVSLANLKSIHIAVESYADRYKGQYPVAQEGVNYQNGCEGVRSGFLRWATIYAWPAVIHEIVSWEDGRSIFLSPRAHRDSEVATSPTSPSCGWPTSYYFSQSFLARPEVWTPDASSVPDADRKNWFRSVYQTDVRFPAGKVMFWDREMPYLNRNLKMNAEGNLEEPAPTLFADGHAAERIQAQATQAVSTTFLNTDCPVQRWHNTPDGVRGVDQ